MIKENSLLKKDNEKYNNFLYIISIFMFLFVPTSVNGISQTVQTYAIKLAAEICFMVIVLFRDKHIKQNIVIMVVTLIYLLIITIRWLFSDYHFSFLVFANFMALFLLFAVNFQNSIDKSFSKKLFILVNIVIIVWGFLIISKNAAVTKWTLNYYDQYAQGLVKLSLIEKIPVTSFGVGSIASFYYFILFLLNFVTIRENEGSILNYMFCFSYIAFTIMTYKNSSLIFSVIMIAMMFFINKKNLYKLIYFAIVIGTAYYFCISGTLQYLMQHYTLAASSGQNGFLGRYSSSLFTQDLEFIKNNFAIGFDKPLSSDTGLYFTDCGFIVYMITGNLPLVISIYYCFYKFLNRNIPIKLYAVILFLIILMFEVAFPILLDSRICFCMAFMSYYLNTILKDKHNCKIKCKQLVLNLQKS